MRKEKEVVFICYAFEYSILIHFALHCALCADVVLDLLTRRRIRGLVTCVYVFETDEDTTDVAKCDNDALSVLVRRSVAVDG